MSKPRLTSQNITTIIISVIGVVGTVTVAYFSFREKTAPMELAIITTQTAEAKQTLLSNTLIPTVSVNTPDILPTEILPTSTALPEQGFSTNCINSTDWTPSPKSSLFSNENNCWDLSSNGIAVQDGKLFFAIQNNAEQRGAIYTPIPKEGTISFNVRIDTFLSGQTNGNLAFGVGTADNWLSKGKYVFFRATDSGYYIVYGGEITEVGKNTIDAYKISSDIVVAYEFKNLVFDIYVDNTKIVSDIPMSASRPQVFWIGYRLLPNSKLVAYVSDFRLEK
jgi:hypothetical protein